MGLAGCSGSAFEPFGVAPVVVASKDGGASLSVFVTVIGDGVGEVAVGNTTCTSTCTVVLPSAEPVLVSARSGVETLPPEISGACSRLPCLVTPPASFVVRFVRGRRVSIVVSGGPGSVVLNDEVVCDGGHCLSVVPRDVELRFEARHDDYSEFERFGGDCSAQSCFFSAGAQAIALVAHFQDSLVWSRQIDAFDPIVAVDEAGVLAAFSARATLQVDGQTYRVQSDASPEFGVIAAFDWDGGTRWITPMNGHRLSDGQSLPRFDSLLRAGDGDVLVSGACRGGGRLNGTTPCGVYDTPIVARIDSTGGLKALSVQPEFGQSAQNQATLTDLIELGSEVFSFRGVGLFAGLSSGSIGLLNTWDGGYAPGFSMVGLPTDFLPLRRRCTARSEGGLVCSLHHTEAFQLDACTVPGSAGSGLDPVILEFDQQLSCVRSCRLKGPGLWASGVSRFDSDGGLLIGGVGAAVDFCGGPSTAGSSAWVARWSGGRIDLVGESPSSFGGGAGLRFNHVERVGDAVVVQADIAAPSGATPELYGRTYTGWVMPLVFLDPNDLKTPLRRWEFRAMDVMNGSSLISSRIAVMQDRIAVWVTGVDVKFGDRFLSRDGRAHSHLVVLRSVSP